MSEKQPFAVIVAGPNGAGKSSAAPHVLKDALRVDAFVNADVIAQGLAAYDPASVAVEAGRILLRRIADLVDRRENFAWETTLSGNTAKHLFVRLRDAGYAIHLMYLWIPSADVSIERVRRRVQSGGHDIPEATIRRRFARGLVNFQSIYRPLSSEWNVFDNREPGDMRLIANGTGDSITQVVDADAWRKFCEQCESDGKVREPYSPYAGAIAAMSQTSRYLNGDDNDDFDPIKVWREGTAINRAITLAHGDVIRRHRAFDIPLVIWKDGRVQSVDPHTYPIPDPDAAPSSSSAR